MELSGCEILDIDGCFDDGWCEGVVRVRLAADCDARELRCGVWIPDEEGLGLSSVFAVTVLGARPSMRAVILGAPYELRVPVKLMPGSDCSFKIECDHLVKNTGGDARSLSFKLTSLVIM